MNNLMIIAVFAFVACMSSCKNPPPAQTPEDGQKQQPGPAEPVPAPPDDETGETDERDPETLVRAVFEALRKGDAELYLGQTIHLIEDYEVLLKSTNGIIGGPGDGPPFPSDKEIAKMCKQHRDGFNDFLALLKEKGLDPSKAAIKEIKTDEAVVKDGYGFAEDLTLVLQQGELVIPVTIDDVLLTPRGWLIADGLKLRE